MRRLLIAAVAVVAVSAAGTAFAARAGTYDGWLYKGGERVKASFTSLRVIDTLAGQRFRLSVYNMPLGCPYLDRYGDPARARFRFIHRGIVEGDRIDDTRQYPSEDPTHEVRVRGRFVGRRFLGRVRVTSAPGVAGACTGRARVRVHR